MTELLWQTFFILAVAFFFGAVVSCGLKRRFYYGSSRKAADIAPVPVMPATPDASQPKIEVAPRAVPEGQRFERALSGTTKVPAGAPSATPVATPRPQAAAAPQPAPIAAPQEPVPQPAKPAPQAAAPAPVAPAPQPAPAPKAVAPTPVAPPAPAPAPMSQAVSPAMAAASAAAMAPTPEAKLGIPRVSVSTGSGAPVKAEEGGGRPSEDLTRIRGIDPVVQAKLKELGIRRFEDLASLTANDVKGLSDTLGVKDRIAEENWVGQAQILGRGGETYFSRRIDHGTPIPPSAEPSAAAPKPAPAPEPEAKPVFPRVSVGTGSGAPVKAEEGGGRPSEDLTRIRGIDPVVQSKLKELGIRRFEDIASLTANDVKGLGDTLGVKDRIAQENWVGQAQILGRGGETYFSRRMDQGAPIPPSVEPSAAAPKPTPTPAPEPEAKPVFPRVSVGTGSGAPVKAEAGGAGPSDDLTRIRGIDPVLQGRLKELGIRRFEELASLSANDVRGLDDALGFKDRVGPENWVGQAQTLARGGETYYSRRLDRGIPVPQSAEPTAVASASAPAAPLPAAASAPQAASSGASDVGYLRSVRSEAFVGEEGGRAAFGHGEVDDLKRIRGIGVLIEKKLNSLGILSFEQVANWTGADIERISNILDFKGRIERENWIEQARILATGGQTEFSRRGER